MLVPLVAHVIFLPIIYMVVRKQKEDRFSPSIMINGLKLIILYMVTFVSLKIIIAILVRDFATTIVFIGLGCFMVYIFASQLQRIKRYM